MDKYDWKSWDLICPKGKPSSEGEPQCKDGPCIDERTRIAAALRESAAEAFDKSAIEAGKLLHAHHVREYCIAEAAALRSTTRGKGA